jgi:hypothetical protein
MQSPSEAPIEAVRNRKTTKLFILVDDTLGTRFKVINPGGETIILPDLLFDEDPVFVPPAEFEAEFTPEQLAAFRKHLEKVAEEVRKNRDRPPPPPTRVEPPAPPRPRSPSAPRAKKTVQPQRRGLGASWDAPRLSFYRHKIDPLDPKQTFRITIPGTGVFEISKEEFLAQFNDAVMSQSYRADGLYTYPQIPEKARKYLKP